MAGISHAAQIDLRFGDVASELLDFRIGRAQAFPPPLTMPDWNKLEG
jgi:hypothetical protein